MKHKKAWLGTAIVLTLTVVGVAFARPFNLHNILFRARASVSMGTIEFDKANSTRSGTTNTTTATTQTGGGIICKTFNNDTSQSSGKVGAVKTGSTIKFFESDGTTEYTFEDLEKISFTHGGTSFGFNLTGIYDDGTSFSLNYGAKTTNPRNINFHDFGNVAHLRVEVTSDVVTILNNITITYNCTTKYLSGVEVSTQPTKTSYSVGEQFDPTGMVVKAVYSNNTKVVTEAYTYSPTRSLLSTDTQIVVSYQGFNAYVPITVEDVSSLSGVYVSSSWRIDFDNLTYTYTVESSVVRFTYIIDGNTISFTYVSGDNTNLGSGRLFDGGSSPVVNSTGKITSSTTITVKTYNPFGGSTTRTFTKQ